MVVFTEKQIQIDGSPVFLLSGELHYYRQPKKNWQHLIDEAKEMGLNCISSYVPWMLHEEQKGCYNFEGNLDLGEFIDLCRDNGLYFFVRPGPYIMAELKKEGLPYWLYDTCKSALPVSFDHKTPSCNTVDYLDASYLRECKTWYEKVLQIVVPRLQSKGGNIIGVQLDNEIGMLNWVTNTPVLNENVLTRFAAFLQNEGAAYPFSLQDKAVYIEKFRTPGEAYSIRFHNDFGCFLRHYYADYALTLKGYAQDCGVEGVPFFINIHGTGEGRIFDFPLGVSQLYEAINCDMIGGTDVYLGEPTEGKYQDLYVINAVTDSMNKIGNPLTSIEFECSDGPYCSLNGMRYDPSATSHKMLLCLSQNARLLSFYVFSGGENYIVKHPKEDGDKRMAFTGQLHGFGAPVQPDGSHNFSFDLISDTAKAIHALNTLVASAKQVTDNIALGFFADYFLTELCYNGSESVRKYHQNLKELRCAGQIDNIGRALLGLQYKFDAVDLKEEALDREKILVFLSARYLSEEIQRKLISFTEEGGRLLLYGELPEYNLEGEPCRLLMERLSLSQPEYIETNHPDFYISFHSTVASIPDFPGNRAQVFQRDKDCILELFESDKMCGFQKPVGKGLLCAVTGNYPAYLPFWQMLLEGMGARSSSLAPFYRQGVYLSQSRAADGQGLLYLLNLDAAEKRVDITVDGTLLWKDFVMGPKFSAILPLQVQLPFGEVVKSTAELQAVTENGVTLKCSQPTDTIVLKTQKHIKPGDFTVSEREGLTYIALKGKSVTLYFE